MAAMRGNRCLSSSACCSSFASTPHLVSTARGRRPKVGYRPGERGVRVKPFRAVNIRADERDTSSPETEVKACTLPKRLLDDKYEQAVDEVLSRDKAYDAYPRVLLLHTGGTLGMDVRQSYVKVNEEVKLKEGTGGEYRDSLQPMEVLSDIVSEIPELRSFATYDTRVVFNVDSCRIGPKEWIMLAEELDRARDDFDAFVVIHGTDTMAFTSTALSLMLENFDKPIIVTGSQLPLAFPRTDARQNLIDAISCAVAKETDEHGEYRHIVREVAICFGGYLMRANRSQKVNTSRYTAFLSRTYAHLAEIGVELVWNRRNLLQPSKPYSPRFKMDANVIRVPVVPGGDPRLMYGDLAARGVKGIILEAFGTGNIPDTEDFGWMPWLRDQRKNGIAVFLTTQCSCGSLRPELYRSGTAALSMGVKSGPIMTPECAVVKMMLSIANPDISMESSIAGEMGDAGDTHRPRSFQL